MMERIDVVDEGWTQTGDDVVYFGWRGRKLSAYLDDIEQEKHKNDGGYL